MKTVGYQRVLKELNNGAKVRKIMGCVTLITSDETMVIRNDSWGCVTLITSDETMAIRNDSWNKIQKEFGNELHCETYRTDKFTFVDIYTLKQKRLLQG